LFTWGGEKGGFVPPRSLGGWEKLPRGPPRVASPGNHYPPAGSGSAAVPVLRRGSFPGRCPPFQPEKPGANSPGLPFLRSPSAGPTSIHLKRIFPRRLDRKGLV